MQKLSRTAKYEQLRQNLQNDNESDIKTESLSPFANRLNQLDSQHFDKMDVNDTSAHDPIHARREAYFDEAVSEPKESASFSNEYLDEYISEVKQYNMKKGLLSAEDTQVNILKNLRGDAEKAPRPFDDEPKETAESFDEKLKTLLQPGIAQEIQNDENTLQIMKIGNQEQDQLRNTISLEIKNMLQESEFKDISERHAEPAQDDEKTELISKLDEEKQLREKLMNETVQLRVQLEEYEDELTDVSDKVVYTNRLLNFILVLLILALLVVLGVVVYWMLLSRGII